MPSTDDHRRQAKHNETVAAHLAGEKTHDWAVTATFYTAVQEVQALVKLRGWKVKKGRGWRAPKNHQERENVIHHHCSGLERDYRTLKNLSEAARYDAEKMSESEFLKAKTLLANIRAEIAKL